MKFPYLTTLTSKQPSGAMMLWLERGPIVAIAIVIVAANLAISLLRIYAPCPIVQWEAGIIRDAWRMWQGQPVYTLVTSAPATHMYGPLPLKMMSWWFAIFGFSNNVARIQNLLCAFLIATLLALKLPKSPNLFRTIVTFGLVFAMNGRCINYFTESRPDMTAMLLGLIAILLWYRGWQRNQFAWFAGGIVVMVLAFLFKQPYAAVAAVPLAAVWLHGGSHGEEETDFRWVVFATLPLVAFAAALLVMRFGFPAVFYYVVHIAGMYPVPPQELVRIAFDYVGTVPLFLLAFVHWLTDRESTVAGDPKLRWILATLIVMIPVSIASHAREGGGPNSLMPAMIAMAAFCIYRMDRVEELLSNVLIPWAGRAMLSLILGVLFFAQAFPAPLRFISIFNFCRTHYLNSPYAQVIEGVKVLPGTVLCPEDPTIPLRARGLVTRSIYMEMDRWNWNYAGMEEFHKDLNAADWVVQVKMLPFDLMTDDRLRSEGFEPVPWETGRNLYVLWKRNVRSGSQHPANAANVPGT